MGGGISKKILTEQSVYYGDVSMPKHWEIDRNELAHHILHSNLTNEGLQFSRTFDKLNTYIKDHIGVKYNISLINKETWGNIYKPQEITVPLLNIDPVDLRNYEDNRRKGRSWDVELKDNMFIMFPSTNMYYLTNNQKDSLNFVQTITYEYI